MDTKQIIINFIETEIKPNTFASSAMIKEIICSNLIYYHNIKTYWNGLTIYVDNKPVCIIRTGKEKLQRGEGSIVYLDSIKWLI